MRSVTPLPWFSCILFIFVGFTNLIADDFCPSVACEPCMQPKPIEVCDSPCYEPASSCSQAFQSGFYFGAFGGVQHMRPFYTAIHYAADGDDFRTIDGYNGECGGIWGFMGGYLYRFCDSSCTMGFEVFYERSNVESIGSNGTFGSRTEWLQLMTDSFGPVLRPGYLLCEDVMVYAVAGLKFTRFRHKANVPRVDFPIFVNEAITTRDSKTVWGFVYGLGIEKSFMGRHQLRAQATQTRYCKVRTKNFVPGVGGAFLQTHTESIELTLAYSYAF